MGPIEALELARFKESEAQELYKKLSQEHKIAEDVFLFLFGEEYKHKLLIEKKIHELSQILFACEASAQNLGVHISLKRYMAYPAKPTKLLSSLVLQPFATPKGRLRFT